MTNGSRLDYGLQYAKRLTVGYECAEIQCDVTRSIAVPDGASNDEKLDSCQRHQGLHVVGKILPATAIEGSPFFRLASATAATSSARLMCGSSTAICIIT